MDAGDYKVAIAFQERIKLPKEEMSYYEDLAEMYVGTDVSPDFYGWVFPKYDHVAVGTGTMQKNQLILLHGSSAHSNMIIFRKYPPIKIRRNISSDIHFSKIFVVTHFFFRQFNSFLKCYSNFVISCIHCFGNSTIS